MSDESSEQILRDEVEQLRSDVRELRSRLWEPEEIVRAIRQGEVDAFVVNESPGEQIYSLRRADLLYRRMIEDMKEGAAALDASGLILYCNSCFAEVVKDDRSNVLGASIFKFVPEESQSFFRAVHHDGATETIRQELALRAVDGSLMPVSATMNRITIDGADVFCLIVTDLQERKRGEELVAESRRKDQFLAMLAHELRNPIAPIRQAAEILRLTCSGEPEVQRARDVIDRQVTQLARLVDDLLDVSRITRGQIRVELEPADLISVIARGLETAAPLIEVRRHELITEFPREPLTVRADAARFSQVISNLLNNAAKFTPQGGRIWLTAQRQDGQARVVVRDTGIGIASEMVPRIFDLFAQADSTLGRSQGGLGIGLTLVRHLVEMHGGTVQVHSEGLGRGCEVTVSLPLLPSDALHPPSPHPASPHPVAESSGTALPVAGQAPSSQRVLVVDDNVDAADSLSALIQCWGHDARMVTDGEAALAQARTFHPRLMLIDIGLPGIDGYQLARELRRMPELKGVVLIAVTGYGRQEDVRRSLEAGFDQHWIKPFDTEALEALLRALATSQRAGVGPTT
jgi:PAS domain S-box-containing protein